MTIHWNALLSVFGVALGSTVAVVVLVTLALLGLSSRRVETTGSPPAAGRSLFSPRVGTAVAAACLGVAAAIVLFGLSVMIVR
jgi:hypothetical protein